MGGVGTSRKTLIFEVENLKFELNTQWARRMVPQFDRLPVVEQLLYSLLITKSGTLDKSLLVALFGIGIHSREKRNKLRSVCARSIGEKLFDVGLSVQEYLNTWAIPSVRQVTVEELVWFRGILPKVFFISAQLQADTYMAKDKNFKEVIALASDLQQHTATLSLDQFRVSRCPNRTGWLEQIVLTVTQLVVLCRMMVTNGIEGWCIFEEMGH